MDTVVLSKSFPSQRWGSLACQMNFIIRPFACVVVVGAKCSTQGLNPVTLALRDRKGGGGAGTGLVSPLCSWAYGRLAPCSQLPVHKLGLLTSGLVWVEGPRGAEAHGTREAGVSSVLLAPTEALHQTNKAHPF